MKEDLYGKIVTCECLSWWRLHAGKTLYDLLQHSRSGCISCMNCAFMGKSNTPGGRTLCGVCFILMIDEGSRWSRGNVVMTAWWATKFDAVHHKNSEIRCSRMLGLFSFDTSGFLAFPFNKMPFRSLEQTLRHYWSLTKKPALVLSWLSTTLNKHQFIV